LNLIDVCLVKLILFANWTDANNMITNEELNGE